MSTPLANSPPLTGAADTAAPPRAASAHPLVSLCARARIEWERRVDENGDVCFRLSEPADAVGMLEGWRVLATVFPGKIRKRTDAFRRRPRWRIPVNLPIDAPQGKHILTVTRSDSAYLAQVRLLWSATEVPPFLVLVRAGRRPEFKTPEEAKAAVGDLVAGSDVSRLSAWPGHDGTWVPAAALPEMFPDPAELARLRPGVLYKYGPPCVVCGESLFHPSHRHNPAGHPYRPDGDQ